REAIEIARRRGLLLVRVAQSAPRRVPAQVVMFTDVGGSTVLFDRLGDLPAYGLQRLHDDLVRDCLARTGGSEVRHTGDGIMASFSSASAAVRCATEIQHALARPDSPGARAGLQVRIGMNAGDVVAAAQDLFGVVVNAAARICALAGPGQILVSA